MNQLLTKIKIALQWSFSNVRLTLELLLIGALIISGWRYNRKVDELNKITAEKQGLEAGLRQQITIRDGQISTLTRQANGSVVYKDRYVPPEGYVIVKEKDQQVLQSEYAALVKQLASAKPQDRPALEKKIADKLAGLDDTVIVRDHGFTLKPGIGMGWANEGIKPRLDIKWYFWKRYGAILGGGENGVGLGLSRHLDDIIWGHPQNLEFYIQYNPITFRQGEKSGELGFRANLW